MTHVFITLAFIAVALTVTMFYTKEAMLGFPSAIFWAILGGYVYGESAVAWDWQFLMAFACLLGMVTFTSLAAYGLREKRDAIGDEGMEHGDGGYFDEEKDKEKPESERTQALHGRASKRRNR